MTWCCGFVRERWERKMDKRNSPCWRGYVRQSDNLPRFAPSFCPSTLLQHTIQLVVSKSPCLSRMILQRTCSIPSGSLKDHPFLPYACRTSSQELQHLWHVIQFSEDLATTSNHIPALRRRSTVARSTVVGILVQIGSLNISFEFYRKRIGINGSYKPENMYSRLPCTLEMTFPSLFILVLVTWCSNSVWCSPEMSMTSNERTGNILSAYLALFIESDTHDSMGPGEILCRSRLQASLPSTYPRWYLVPGVSVCNRWIRAWQR